ncbi:MAG: DUF4142 domain-containing protein [Limisphaerales bacterium]
MRKLVSSLLLLTVAMTFSACRTAEPRPATTRTMGLQSFTPGVQDRMFVNDAMLSGRNEIEMARIGAQRADNLDLRLLSQRIVDDHTRANQELIMLARQERIVLPDLDQEPQTHTAHLSALQGPEFDRVFLQHMLDAHRTDIKKFEAASRTAQNPEIRAFAARTLPKLREHLRIAQNISRIAAIGPEGEIFEPAGAERPGPAIEPYYESDALRRYQLP